jgi:hypothetical protein
MTKKAIRKMMGLLIFGKGFSHWREKTYFFFTAFRAAMGFFFIERLPELPYHK